MGAKIAATRAPCDAEATEEATGLADASCLEGMRLLRGASEAALAPALAAPSTTTSDKSVDSCWLPLWGG